MLQGPPVSERLSRVTTPPELRPGIAQEAVQRPPGTRCLLEWPPHRSEAQLGRLESPRGLVPGRRPERRTHPAMAAFCLRLRRAGHGD